jgi:kinesin family protein C2/C3
MTGGGSSKRGTYEEKYSPLSGNGSIDDNDNEHWSLLLQRNKDDDTEDDNLTMTVTNSNNNNCNNNTSYNTPLHHHQAKDGDDNGSTPMTMTTPLRRQDVGLWSTSITTNEISGEVLEEAVRMHAVSLGMDPLTEDDKEFLWIARESLLADPPKGWIQQNAEDDESDQPYYYYHAETNQVTYEHPGDSYYKALFEKKRAERQQQARQLSMPNVFDSPFVTNNNNRHHSGLMLPHSKELQVSPDDLPSVRHYRYTNGSGNRSGSGHHHHVDRLGRLNGSTGSSINHVNVSPVQNNANRTSYATFEEHWNQILSSIEDFLQHELSHSDTYSKADHHQQAHENQVHKRLQELTLVLHQYTDTDNTDMVKNNEGDDNNADNQLLRAARQDLEERHNAELEESKLQQRDEVERLNRYSADLEQRLSEASKQDQESIEAIRSEHAEVVEDLKANNERDWQKRLILQSEVKTLQQDLEETREQHKITLKESEERANDSRAKKVEIAQETHRHQVQQLQQTVANLQQEVERCREREQELKDEANEQSTKSAAQAEQLRRDNEETGQLMHDKTNDVQQKLNKSQARETELSEARVIKEEQLDQCRTELEIRTKANDAVAQRSTELDQQLKGSKQDLIATKEALDRSLAELERMKQEFEKERERHRHAFLEAESREKDFEETLNTARLDKEDVMQQARRLKKSLAKKDDELSCFLNSMEQMQKDLISKAEQEIKLGQELEGWTDQFNTIKMDLEAEKQKNAHLHRQVSDLQGNIRVFCRVRPLRAQEVLEMKDGTDDPRNLIDFVDDEHMVFSGGEFTFDKVFDQSSDQKAVYSQVSSAVATSLDGCSVCIFAYGQTSSGKTYTMEGTDYEKGVYFQALEQLFYLSHNNGMMADVGGGKTDTDTYMFEVSVLEVYNETIKDLLVEKGSKAATASSSDGLDIRVLPDEVYVEGLVSREVTCLEDVEELLTLASSNRQVANNNLNEHSSRSHLVLSVAVTCHLANTRSKNGVVKKGKLTLIDLAGSERLKNTGASGIRLKEAQHINRSLSSLGDVIQALGNGSSHVPYRNSKLTFLLQDSLKPSSRVLMFVNISPAARSVGESICSLRFASRCRKVQLGKARKEVGSSRNGNGTPSKSSSSYSKRSSFTSTPKKLLPPRGSE